MEFLANETGLSLSIVNGILFLAIASLSYFILRFLFRALTKRLEHLSKRTASKLDDLILSVFNRTSILFFVASALYLAAHGADVTPKLTNLVNKVFVVVTLLQAALWSTLVVNYFVKKVSDRHANADEGSHKMVQATFQFIAQVVVWTLFVLLILDNLGVNISALIAGLGVGGIAVALALQNILGDLFASLSIVLDKPFVLGDFIVVGDQMGTVERIGMKTTRLRALGGEQLVFANNDLLQSRIQNYKRMQERRVEFKFGVVYQTPISLLRTIPELCKSIVTSLERTRFDRAHFAAFGDSDLSFVVVYYVLSADYNDYMNIQQSINFALLEQFSARGIQFAYPTQTLFIDSLPEVKLNRAQPNSNEIVPSR